jgi:hypothetical protein
MNLRFSVFQFAILICGCLYIQSSFSQENYIPGYVIDHKGDTVSGLIDYRDWAKNPKEIIFKVDMDSEAVTYSPLDIQEFRVENSTYIGAVVELEASPLKTAELSTISKLDIRTDTFFLRTLINGPKSLYHLTPKGGRDQFYIKRDTVIDLLLYKRYLDQRTMYTKENIMYKRQLTLYFHDCPEIQSKLENIDYNQKSLSKLFLTYYDCVDADVDFKQKKEKEKVTVEYGILVGVSMTSLNFEGTFYTFLPNTDFSLSTDFTGGLCLDIVLPFYQKKWSLNNELIYTSYNTSGTNTDYPNEYTEVTTESVLKYSYIKLNTIVRFKYPVKTVFIYINAGMSNGYAIAETNLKKVESKYLSGEDYEESRALEKSRKYEQGFLIGIGTRVKKFSFEVRYDKGNGMSSYSTLLSSTSRYAFIVGYIF